MTGPDHYREAEDLLNSAENEQTGSDTERYFLGAAQVHATLALAAATALNNHDPNGNGMPKKEYTAWFSAAGS